MNKWLEKHECNEVCKALPMKKEQAILDKLNLYLKRFKERSFDQYVLDLKVIFGDLRN